MLPANNQPCFSEAETKIFIEQLNQQARSHRAINHPYLKRLAAGDFVNPTTAVKDFCFHYLAYSVDFLRFLTVTISKLDQRKHREWLIGNLMEESGRVDDDDAAALAEIGVDLCWVQGVPHPELYMRFLDAIGMDQHYRAQHDFCDEAKIWSHMFLNVCTGGNAAQAVGAMGLGTENIVKFVYKPILKAIDLHLDVSRKDRVFFDLHALLDDEHGEILDEIAVHYARYQRHRDTIRDGMLMALNLRASFFDAMMVRADSMADEFTSAVA